MAEQAATNPTPSLESLIQHITAPGANPASLAHTLRTFAPLEVREVILASLLPGPQDPLALLDPSVNTVGLLFILYVDLLPLTIAAWELVRELIDSSLRYTRSARLAAGPAAHPVDLVFVERFCANFDPQQARAAPERGV
jgi:COP9 signalosome complex subunit 3